MRRGEAIVFPTGRTPHTAFSLPLEAPLGALMADLAAALGSEHGRSEGASAESVAGLCGAPRVSSDRASGDGSETDVGARIASSCGESLAMQPELCALARRAVTLKREVCALHAGSTSSVPSQAHGSAAQAASTAQAATKAKPLLTEEHLPRLQAELSSIAAQLSRTSLEVRCVTIFPQFSLPPLLLLALLLWMGAKLTRGRTAVALGRK